MTTLPNDVRPYPYRTSVQRLQPLLQSSIGIPGLVHSDQGRNFEAIFFKEILRLQFRNRKIEPDSTEDACQMRE